MQDMTSDKLMDRLIIGDVGFGKTEVAMRAAFKAILDGKQVAYLVQQQSLQDNTTILLKIDLTSMEQILLCWAVFKQHPNKIK